MLLWVTIIVGIVGTAILIKIMDEPTTILGVVDLIVVHQKGLSGECPFFKKHRPVVIHDETKGGKLNV